MNTTATTATTGIFGRFGLTAMRLVGAMAMALLLMGAVADHAGAEANNGPAMDKGAFKSGCEAGGGSYIENNDGSFQCNLKSGGTIKCQNTTSPCTYTATLVGGVGGGKVSVVNVIATKGNLQMAPAATPTPTKGRVSVSGLNISKTVDASTP